MEEPQLDPDAEVAAIAEEAEEAAPEEAPPPPPPKPPTPRYCKPTKASLNRKEKPDPPPNAPLLYPPPKNVLKLTRARERYQVITRRQVRRRVRRPVRQWVPARVFTPMKTVLPQVRQRPVGLPQYIEGEFHYVRQESTPEESGESERSELSDFSDGSFDLQPAEPATVGFGRALPKLHGIITAYRHGIDLRRHCSC